MHIVQGFDLGRNPIRFPVRVVMNNQTITVFAAGTYDTVITSFDLDYLVYHPDPTDAINCLMFKDMRDGNKMVTLCAWPAALRLDQTPEKFMREWMWDIEKYRSICRGPRQIMDTSDRFVSKMNKMVDIAELKERAMNGNERHDPSLEGMQGMQKAMGVSSLLLSRWQIEKCDSSN